MNNILCGIDEAGRGPFAGPMVVAGVILKNDKIGRAHVWTPVT